MSKFYIVQVIAGQEPVEIGSLGEFADGKEAARVAKENSTATVKFQARPRKEADPNAWREREAKRFKDGTYKPLPVSWAVVSAKNPDHFLHVSLTKPELVAYFASPEDGQRDRITETTPGRYIGQFTDLDVTGEQAKHLIAEIDASRTGVLFAWSRADFKRIYENGPSSCMNKSASSFPYGGIHPAEMYAAGDLALAHFWDDKAKKATARVVCWPEKKLYGRVYGDTARLTKALTDIGFKPVSTFPAGVRFHKLENPNRKGHYVAPYLDNFACSLTDEGDFAVTLDSNLAQSKYPKDKRILTRGSYGEWIASKLCPKLQNMQPDLPDSDIPGGGKWEFVHGIDEEWSPAALKDYSFTCHHSKKRYPKDNKYMMTISGHTYARAIANEIGSFTCSVMKTDYLKTDLHGEVDGKLVSKAGHIHLQRIERLKADRERERQRLVAERERWQREMDLVEATVPSKDKSVGMNHHVVLSGAVGTRPSYGTVFVGNSFIAEQHEEGQAAA